MRMRVLSRLTRRRRLKYLACAVLTGIDYFADGLGPIPHNAGILAPPDLAVRLRDSAPIATPHWPMPSERVRFVGEPVAIVVAETIAAARDAAGLIEVTYEPLPAVALAADAVKPGAPLLWNDAPGNVCIDIEVGDETATASARAAHIVRLETRVQRVTSVPPEPRTTAAEYETATGQYTLYTGSGRGVVKARLDLAWVLGVPPEQVRCVCGNMGGNFGTHNFILSGIRAASLGGTPGWPAGQMGGRAQRIVPERLPGQGSYGRGGACSRQPRKVSGGAWLEFDNLGAYSAVFV
jgi:CO/xanthine dehydrogenase Mo-binding subunit